MATIYKCVNSLYGKCFNQDRNRKCRTHTLSEEQLHEIWATLAKSPRQLILQFAQQRSISSSPARNWTELLHLHLYKTTLVHKHCDTECEARLNFLNWIPSRDARWRNRPYTSMKFSWTDSRIKMWSFSEILGTNSIPIFRVCWCGDSVTCRNVRETSYLNATVCLRKFHWILLLQMLPDLDPTYVYFIFFT
jgi:hypothetical protein